MTSSELIAREPVPWGEGRLRRGEITSVFFEVEWQTGPGPADGPKLFEADWDPRDSSHYLFVTMRWARPSRAVTAVEREPLLDALWALAPLAGGVTTIVEQREDYHIVCRWRAAPGHHIVRVFGSTVEYSELGRTMHVPFEELHENGASTAGLIPEAAIWRYPQERAVSDQEWDELRATLESTERHNLYDTPHPWNISAPPRG